MSVAGRFEILSPVFSGAVETSTARDAQTSEIVLLHFVPADRTRPPEEVFHQLAPACPGKILASGVDGGRSFVVTDYPRDRKAVLLWIRQLSGFAAPPKPAVAEPPSKPPSPVAAPPLPPKAAAAEIPVGITRMFDPAAIFGDNAARPKPEEPPPPPRAAAAAASAGTRMFDPAAVLGATAPKPKETSAASISTENGGTRMFDPAAALFGAPVANPKEPGKRLEVSDSTTAPGVASNPVPPRSAEAGSSGATKFFSRRALAAFFTGPAADRASSTTHNAGNDAEPESPQSSRRSEDHLR